MSSPVVTGPSSAEQLPPKSVGPGGRGGWAITVAVPRPPTQCGEPVIAQNVHPKVIQSRLGHSSITVTMDTYGHLLPSLNQEVAEGLEVIYQKAKIQTASAHLVHDLQDVNLDQ